MSLPVRRDRPLVPVTQFMVYVTEECNLRCSYCFVDKQPRHMTWSTAKNVVDYCLQPEVSGSEEIWLNFFGGEPLLRAEMLGELLTYIASRPGGERVNLGVTTNGTLAGEPVRHFLQKGKVHSLISLDGDRASHEFRPKLSGGNSWGHLERNLRKLIAWSASASIRMTYHPSSLNLVEKVQAVQKLGAGWILLSPVVEADWSGHERELHEHSNALSDWFIQEFEAGRTVPIHHHWNLLAAHHVNQGRDIRPGKACPLGTQLIAFDAAGNILPCHRYLYRKNERFGVVGRTRGLPARRMDFVLLPRAEIPDCEKCPARAYCGGGCRVVALEAGLGLHGVHPNHCLLTREHAFQIQRIYQALRDHPRFIPALLSHREMHLMFQEAQPIFTEE